MSFLGSLFGGGATDQARNDINAGANAATGYLNSGQSQALGNLASGYGGFQSYLSPYVQGGQTGYNAYQSALGLNGAGAQQGIASAYLNSPIQQQINALTMQGINRAYAPTGQGGAATQATTNALLGNWNNYLGQLGANAQQGQAAGGMAAGGAYRYGGDQATTNMGTAQLLANLRMGQGNALSNLDLAQAAQGSNNLSNILKTVGTGASIAAMFM